MDRPIATTATSFLLSRAWRQLSVSFNKAEQQECPCRNPDIFSVLPFSSNQIELVKTLDLLFGRSGLSFFPK